MRLIRLLLSIVMPAAVIGLAAPLHVGAAEATVISVVAPPAVVIGTEFGVDIAVDNAYDVGAYEVELSFDSSKLAFVSRTNGTFLSGSSVVCLFVVIRTTETTTTVQFGCVTAGSVPTSNTNGVLATVRLRAIGAGTSVLALREHTQLGTVYGDSIESTKVDGNVTVVEKSACSANDFDGDGAVTGRDVAHAARQRADVREVIAAMKACRGA